MFDAGPPVCCQQDQIDLLLLCVFDQLQNRWSDHHSSEDLEGTCAIISFDALELLFGLLQPERLARLFAHFVEQREMRLDHMHYMQLAVEVPRELHRAA